MLMWSHLVSPCGILNIIDPNNLIGNATIGRYGLVGVAMTLLEEMCHYGGGL